MKDLKVHIAPVLASVLKFFGFFLLLFFLSPAAFAQNTKGDRPVKNERQIRETKAKSVRKKEKRRTRDIANRRLRTRNQSSANRANAKYPQPSPYTGRAKELHKEKAAQPRGRVFTKSPRESKTRPWKGDVSGYPLKRIKASRNEAARNNVYPQGGEYGKAYRKRPKEEKPTRRIARNIKGRRVGQQQPQYQERAWKGGVDKGPIKNFSATGSFKNVYPQKGPYVAHYRKRLDQKERATSNRKELARVKRFSQPVRTGGSQGSLMPAPASRPFIQRGKKNVYWGKFSRKERPYTGDITGAPLRTRNYKSAPAGLVGRDTLAFFGRKPFGDQRSRVGGGGYKTATKKGQRGWKGDVAGWKLRKARQQESVGVGEFFFQRPLSISDATEKAGKPIHGSGYKSISRRGESASRESISARVYARTDLSGKVKKGIKKSKGGGGSVSGGGWNNQGEPVKGKAPGLGAVGVGGFSGTQQSGPRGFSRQGAGYSGNIKRSSISGFGANGVNYSGKIKGGQGTGFSRQGAGYSGNINRSDVPGFGRQGAGFAGNIKRRRPEKGGGSAARYAGDIEYVGPIKTFNENGVGYSGKIKRSSLSGFDRQGAGFAGNIKARHAKKGGGSISGTSWNNEQHAVQVRAPKTEGGAGFGGNIKFKRPPKGGGSVSGKLWNNEQHAIQVRAPKSEGGADFAGNIKFKRPPKGGGSVSGKLWNNDGQHIENRVPHSDDPKAVNYSGKIALARFKKNYVQNPNSSKESVRKQRPDPTTYRVAGLQVKVREGDYKKKPNASKLALPGVAPTKSSVKASEYARGMKQYWHYKQNPHSADGALKVIMPGKAMARINDYQGNVKMHKYSGSRLHPDAQFAHGYRDNVKEERTFLMNVKLIWGKLFRKSETQPENLKEKNRRPRYDKREKGLWYE